MLYHARKSLYDMLVLDSRTPRMQKIEWDKEGIPVLGVPQKEGVRFANRQALLNASENRGCIFAYARFIQKEPISFFSYSNGLLFHKKKNSHLLLNVFFPFF